MAQTTGVQDPFFLNHHLHMAPVPNNNQQSDRQHREDTPSQAIQFSLLANFLSTLSLIQTVQSESLRNSHTPSSSHSSPSLQTADPNASIQSILTANKDVASSSKRKLEDAEPEDPHSKIRRIVRDHVSQDPSRVMPMTTVICLHAAVAQKSYGSEKRFLCPPPVVHIEGPVWHMRAQQLAMAVVSESGERSFEQKAPLDNNMTASFKFLHVTGTAKAKSFQLSLDIAEPSPPALVPEGADPPSGRVWASFDSAPVTIISKPSKKTAKTRNISSCILAGGPVSLFNRINSQTVRTKYMTIDGGQLCASNVSWSAFNVNVVRKPGMTVAASSVVTGPQPVTYGCEIVLSDTHSGISTSPLVIRKVDKGKVTHDEGGPVSQMQKIALQRVNPDGSRHYLSAAGPIPGTPGVVAPPAPGMSSQAGTHPLLFQSPRVREEIKEGFRIVCDEVDDYLCWTIVAKFQYTFFDAFGQNNNIPELPITPFPTLFTAPAYRPANNTVELTVSNFFYEHPTTRHQTPLDVYLGNLGPLHLRVYQAAPPGPLSTINSFMPGAPGEGRDSASISSPPTRYIGTPLHTVVIVEMPPLADVIKALEDDALPTNNNTNGSKSHQSPDNAEGSEPPPPPMPSIAGRSLPLLFIRASDGVGYHSGRTIACENVFQAMDLGSMAANHQQQQNGQPGMETNWIAAAAAQAAAAAADGGMHGWTLRVM
ncbi:hypothetical protein CVT25_005672 [Psilocybe cyanescens]|uniref:RBP-J/Cbf11/Cbf12 DNA binding domain-containing protein n=1 Tax=Psilocybe cyanescens TaxID=93625 RepID=A0A409VLC8_PSICY|nr:hypothetical protein CVT25_005672 [Psilocybe cyanescens]